jgi:hypothetical protein
VDNVVASDKEVVSEEPVIGIAKQQVATKEEARRRASTSAARCRKSGPTPRDVRSPPCRLDFPCPSIRKHASREVCSRHTSTSSAAYYCLLCPKKGGEFNVLRASNGESCGKNLE